jgi:hypothetical protein
MVTVAVYGFAILLNVQWLRFAGIYGLFYIFVKAWIMLATWLSTSSAYWGMMANSTLNYEVNFACIFITLLIYYSWQKRTGIRIDQLTYYVGLLASYDLFLVFSFLLEFILFNFSGGLVISLEAILLLITAACPTLAIVSRKKWGLGRRTTYLVITNLALLEIWATLVLLIPLTLPALSQNPWMLNVIAVVGTVVTLAAMTAIALSVVQKFRKMVVRTEK